MLCTGAVKLHAVPFCMPRGCQPYQRKKDKSFCYLLHVCCRASRLDCSSQCCIASLCGADKLNAVPFCMPMKCGICKAAESKYACSHCLTFACKRLLLSGCHATRKDALSTGTTAMQVQERQPDLSAAGMTVVQRKAGKGTPLMSQRRGVLTGVWPD